MIEAGDGFYIQPDKVVAIKKSSLGEGKCTVFTVGQSAQDGGFVVDMDAEDLADKIDSALEEED